MGAEVAHLLIWFAETHKIPKISADRKSGGFSVMGWSSGVSNPMALFGCPEFVGKDTYMKLEPYFRQFIFDDAAFLSFGYDQPPEGYDPFVDPDYPANFADWLSSYYNHPDIASRSIHGLNFDKHGELPNPDDPKSTGRPCTIASMTEEEINVQFDATASSRSDFPLFTQMKPTLKIVTQKVLFDEKLASEILPRSQFVYISCTRSVWYCVYAMFETERRHKEHLKQGHKVRPIRFMEIEGANHFAHRDDPEKLWAAIMDAIKN